MEENELTPAEVAAAQRLLRDGALFQQSVHELVSWFSKNHDIVFIESPYGGWISKNRKVAGTQCKYGTFHEMLIANIEAIRGEAVQE